MDSIIMKFRDKFIDEARSLLDNLEVALLGLERTPDDKELIDSAFRAMHTLKGVSGMYGFVHITNFTHHFESIYQSIRDGQLAFNKIIFDLTFSSIDHIRNLLTDENLVNTVNIAEHEKLMSSLENQKLQDENSIVKPPVDFTHKKTDATWLILLYSSEKQFFRGISFMSIFRDLADLGEYAIFKVANFQKGDFDTWSVYLYSNASESEIREVLMFIEDDCVINRISDGIIISNDQNVNPLFKKQTKTLDSIQNFISNAELDNNPVEIKNIGEDTPQTNERKKTAPVEKIKELVKEVQAIEKITNKRISVDSQKLDNLMFLVSELITVNSQLLVTTRNPKHFELRPLIEKVDNLSKLFRNNALEIRLVPISDIVLKFQRLVRDLSKQLGKKVEFESQGTETMLDKSIIDQLAEPLMHIIRNCLDHGIETPDERTKKGKPETGILALSAYNVGNFVNISISDDGNGIDMEKVRKKAIDKNIISANHKLTEKETYDLLFLPGFSTAQSLTDVSGRGVGMDVVKQRITDLRGEVFVESEPGKGTSFILKLQQSLSIIDTLLFRVETTFFIIPLSNIEVCDEITDTEIEANRHTSTIPYNRELIYFVDLRHTFNLPNIYTAKTKMIIVNNEFTRIALLVDKIEGEHQAVLKPLGESFKNQKYITSVSQLGDGNNAFMIDTGALIRDSKAKTNVEIEMKSN